MSAKRNATDGFIWIGLALTLACFAVVLASNTDLIFAREHTRFPLSWLLGGGAILAFLAAELSHVAFSRPIHAEEPGSPAVPEFEAVES